MVPDEQEIDDALQHIDALIGALLPSINVSAGGEINGNTISIRGVENIGQAVHIEQNVNVDVDDVNVDARYEAISMLAETGRLVDESVESNEGVIRENLRKLDDMLGVGANIGTLITLLGLV